MCEYMYFMPPNINNKTFIWYLKVTLWIMIQLRFLNERRILVLVIGPYTKSANSAAST